MSGKRNDRDKRNVTRREFVKASAITAGALAATSPLTFAQNAGVAGSDMIKVGLIGCGGRGTGAAFNAMEASERVHVVALADVFQDHLEKCRSNLQEHAERATISDDRCYVGFDAFQKLLDSGVDMVILATPPHFRPLHFAAAVDAGCHVFMEKPVAVDPQGIRMVIESGSMAEQKQLSVVAGTQRRHELCYLEMMDRIGKGAIGNIVAGYCYWNMGFLWQKERQPSWSDMEWQLRNWLYFTWLSGDHIVEQHVHNLDVCNWAIGSHPIKCMGMGGREVRTDPVNGNIFDHHTIVYEYPDNVFVTSMCRQIAGCANNVSEMLLGSEGRALSSSGRAVIEGENKWRFHEKNPNPYVQEHRDLIASIEGGRYYNEARQVAESTMTAIMGRMSTYTGQEVTWEQAMNSELVLDPPSYSFGELPVRAVAVPGQTPLI